MKHGIQIRIINIFTFIAHVILAGIFSILGYVGVAFSDNMAYLAFLLSLLIFITSLRALTKKSTKLFYTSVAVSAGSIFAWCVIVSSFDALPVLILYLGIFIPVVLYRRFL